MGNSIDPGQLGDGNWQDRAVSLWLQGPVPDFVFRTATRQGTPTVSRSVRKTLERFIPAFFQALVICRKVETIISDTRVTRDDGFASFAIALRQV
jgi:hypothetical protein